MILPISVAMWVTVLLKWCQESNQSGIGVLEFIKPNAIRILNEEKKRRYDHVFWSCDGYKKQTDGYLKPDGQSDYADQVRLYMY